MHFTKKLGLPNKRRLKQFDKALKTQKKKNKKKQKTKKK